MATDVRTPADLVQESFDAVGAQDLDRLAALWDDDTVDVFLALGTQARGRAALRGFFAELFAALPDMVFTAEAIHDVDATTAIGQWHLEGTFCGGPFQGIEPTGRRVALRGIDVMEFEDGILRTNTVYYDGLAFARQVGLLPPAESAADRGMLAAFNALTRARAFVRDRTGRA